MVANRADHLKIGLRNYKHRWILEYGRGQVLIDVVPPRFGVQLEFLRHRSDATTLTHLGPSVLFLGRFTLINSSTATAKSKIISELPEFGIVDEDIDRPGLKVG